MIVRQSIWECAASVCIGLCLAAPTWGQVADVENTQHAKADDESAHPVTPVVHVEVRGKGPIPVVLIPDVGYDWTVFDTFMDRNSERYTMYAVTLAGMAGTEPPPMIENSDFDDLQLLRNAVDSIVLVIEQRKLNTPVVIGHGIGGHIAVWLATRRPGMARCAISLDGMPYIILGDQNIKLTDEERRNFIRNRIIADVQKYTPETWAEYWKKTVYKYVTEGDRAVELAKIFLTTSRGVAVEMGLEMYFSDLRPDLQTTKVPILFAAVAPPGTFFGVIARSWNSVLDQQPINTTLVAFEECRHFVMDDDPWQLDSVVRNFILGNELKDSKVSQGITAPINPELADGKELP